MKLKPVYKKTTRINLRISDDMLSSIERLSHEYGLSISELIRQILVQAVKDLEKRGLNIK